MDRVKFIDHKGEEILLIDFSELKPEDFPKIIKKSEEVIEDQPENSVLTLTDVTDAHYNREVLDEMREYTEHNKPYVKKAAVIGIEGVKSVAYKTVVILSGRDIKTFDTKEEGKNWLVGEVEGEG